MTEINTVCSTLPKLPYQDKYEGNCCHKCLLRGLSNHRHVLAFTRRWMRPKQQGKSLLKGDCLPALINFPISYPTIQSSAVRQWERRGEKTAVLNGFCLCSELTIKVFMYLQLFQDGVRFQEDSNSEILRRQLSFQFFLSFWNRSLSK
jgi:hypothetical protein